MIGVDLPDPRASTGLSRAQQKVEAFAYRWKLPTDPVTLGWLAVRLPPPWPRRIPVAFGGCLAGVVALILAGCATAVSAGVLLACVALMGWVHLAVLRLIVRQRTVADGDAALTVDLAVRCSHVQRLSGLSLMPTIMIGSTLLDYPDVTTLPVRVQLSGYGCMALGFAAYSVAAYAARPRRLVALAPAGLADPGRTAR